MQFIALFLLVGASSAVTIKKPEVKVDTAKFIVADSNAAKKFKKAEVKLVDQSQSELSTKKGKTEHEKSELKNHVSNERLTKQQIDQRVEENYSGPQVDVGPIDKYVDFWYVNMKESQDRRFCMDKQIEEMGMKPHRFKALTYEGCAKKNMDINECLAERHHGDCAKGGLNLWAVGQHGSAGNSELDRQYKIVSNWCSHKRMMEKMLQQNKAIADKKERPKYAIVLEDDVAFDRKEFLRKVVNFAEKYDGDMNSTWSMVQIDPFGSKCDKHIVGKFEGLPVWKPKNVNQGWECSNYWGAQALLVKYDKLPSILSHMENNPTVPLDWLPAHLPAGLAWRANIALNPEASRSVHMKVPMPQFCQKSVKQSTIGFRQKGLSRAFSLSQTSGESILDASKATIDPADDAEYSKLLEDYNSFNPQGSYWEWMELKEAARKEMNKYGIN